MSVFKSSLALILSLLWYARLNFFFLYFVVCITLLGRNNTPWTVSYYHWRDTNVVVALEVSTTINWQILRYVTSFHLILFDLSYVQSTSSSYRSWSRSMDQCLFTVQRENERRSVLQLYRDYFYFCCKQ